MEDVFLYLGINIAVCLPSYNVNVCEWFKSTQEKQHTVNKLLCRLSNQKNGVQELILHTWQLDGIRFPP